MNKILISLVFISQFSIAFGFNDVPKVRKIDQTRQKSLTFLNPEYLVYTPHIRSETKLPLMIYLHGAGGKGGDINKIKGQTKALWQGIHEFNKGRCLLVAPQCLKIRHNGQNNSTWIPDDLNVLLEHLRATLPVDHTRIYLTGNSMGGYGTWVWGAHNPEHFAAIAPVSDGIGAGGPKDITPNLETWAQNLATIPVYAFVGENDKVVPPNRSERLITAIQEAGNKQAQLKIYPDQGHNVRTIVYASMEFYDWLFSH